MKPEDSFPIIVGVGQVVQHWDGEDVGTAPHPVGIVQKAIDLALQDAGAGKLAEKVDCAAFVRTFSDSLRKPCDPFGKVKNFPCAVISKSAINPKQALYGWG